MKIKIIEIYGTPGSGKTTLMFHILSFLKKNNIYAFTSRSLVCEFANKFLDLSVLQVFVLFYYKIINLKKQKLKENQNTNFKQKNLNKKNYKTIYNNFFSNYIRKEYFLICKKIYNKYIYNNKKLGEYYKSFFKNLDSSSKELLSFWIYEIIASYYIAKNLNLNKKSFLILDEGLICKANLNLYLKKNSHKFLKRYLQLILYPDYCFYITIDKKKIFKINKIRQKQNIESFINQKQYLIFKKLEKKMIKIIKKKVSFFEIKNHYDFNNNLQNILLKKI